MIKAIVNEIDAMIERDPAARSRLEVALCYPSFHAIMAYRIANKLWRRQWRLLPRFISQLARWFTAVAPHHSLVFRMVSIQS